jgi:hypothetical protein
MQQLAAAAAVVLYMSASCTAVNPDYCDEEKRPCTDPERPFCDIDGEYPASNGVKNVCIPSPFGSSTDARADGSALDDGAADVSPAYDASVSDGHGGDGGEEPRVDAAKPDLTGQLQIAPATAQFGEAFVGTVGAERLFSVSNTGNLQTSSIAVELSSSAFSVSGNSCVGPLDPDQTCSIRVVFVPGPAAVGEHAATLEVVTGSGGRVSAAVAGSAVSNLLIGLTISGPDPLTPAFCPRNAGLWHAGFPVAAHDNGDGGHLERSDYGQWYALGVRKHLRCD